MLFNFRITFIIYTFQFSRSQILHSPTQTLWSRIFSSWNNGNYQPSQFICHTSFIHQPIPFQVRLLSARATCTFITECVDESQYKLFADIYPGVLEVSKSFLLISSILTYVKLDMDTPIFTFVYLKYSVFLNFKTMFYTNQCFKYLNVPLWPYLLSIFMIFTART